MAEPSLPIVKETVIDLLDNQQSVPALSSTSDMPVIETKPDSQPAVPPKEEVKPEGEAEQLEESATSTTDEHDGQPAAEKTPRGVGKRLAALTAEREAEKRRAEAAEARLDAALKALESAGKPVESKPDNDEAEPARPLKSDYPDPDAWDAAIMAYADEKATWSARREVKTTEAARLQREQTAAIEEGQRVARDAYNARIDKILEKHPDFNEVATSPDIEISMPMAHAIIHSERGPDLQYYLGQNPDEAKRITALAPPLQLVELGLILAKIDAPAAPKPISAAPRPIHPIKAGSEVSAKDPNDMSMDEYKSYTLARDRGKDMRH